MKKLALYILLLMPLLAGAQKQYRLTGYIGIKGGVSFHYQVVFTDSAGVMVHGYTITYDDATRSAKTLLEGSIDRANHTITFRETEIVSNEGFYSPVVLCLVNATLKYMVENGRMILNGPITSKDKSEAECTSGSISLINDEEIAQLWKNETVVKKDTVAIPPKVQLPKRKVQVIYDTGKVTRGTPADERNMTPDQITSGADKTYEWNTDTVVLDIWDGGHIDGDVVTILFNNETILRKYTLTKDQRQLRIPLGGKAESEITIIAENEGNEAPNTANITLTDGSKQYLLVAYNEAGRRASVKIRKRK
ncbi:hypothetical protein ACTHGU_15485 [Chitinophagaceae bacterium MMS25-I14]